MTQTNTTARSGQRRAVLDRLGEELSRVRLLKLFPVALRVPSDDIKRLRRAADAHGTTSARLARLALALLLDELERPEPAAKTAQAPVQS